VPVFRLDPVPETANDPRWEASKIHEPFWIVAASEAQAREWASLILTNFVTRRPGKPVVYSPWLDAAFADCAADNPPLSVPDGIIVTVGGQTHS
jgi:hypothetical protein